MIIKNTNCETCAHKNVCGIKDRIKLGLETLEKSIGYAFPTDIIEEAEVSFKCKEFKTDYKPLYKDGINYGNTII